MTFYNLIFIFFTIKNHNQVSIARTSNLCVRMMVNCTLLWAVVNEVIGALKTGYQLEPDENTPDNTWFTVVSSQLILVPSFFIWCRWNVNLYSRQPACINRFHLWWGHFGPYMQSPGTDIWMMKFMFVVVVLYLQSTLMYVGFSYCLCNTTIPSKNRKGFLSKFHQPSFLFQIPFLNKYMYNVLLSN